MGEREREKEWETRMKIRRGVEWSGAEQLENKRGKRGGSRATCEGQVTATVPGARLSSNNDQKRRSGVV